MSEIPLKILDHQHLGVDARLLRLERPKWSWQAGQLISLGGKDPLDQRDYSIASGEQDESLDVIYRLIPHGVVTPYLSELKPGDVIPVQGPYGRFTLRDSSRPVLFCATGTGIAPCRAFLRSHPLLQLTLFHGVRVSEDLYFKDEFSGIQYFPFCSKEAIDGHMGRLSEVLKTHPLPEHADIYLCGANEMIYEVEEILLNRGVKKDRIFNEPYYYRAYDKDETLTNEK